MRRSDALLLVCPAGQEVASPDAPHTHRPLSAAQTSRPSQAPTRMPSVVPTRPPTLIPTLYVHSTYIPTGLPIDHPQDAERVPCFPPPFRLQSPITSPDLHSHKTTNDRAFSCPHCG
jgi:hypothetical protein